MEHALVEALDLSEVKVDRDACVIHNVKLSGKRSRNKHKKHGKPIIYSDDSIRQSASLFESCPVTVRRGHDRATRDYDAQNGQLRNGRLEHLGTEKAASRFDWHLNSSDPLTAKIMEDAEKFPQNCPLSQEVLEWTESLDTDGNVLIESLTTDPMKIGVAVVYRGGLNDSLFEALEEDMEIKTKEELTARFPSLVEELTECACQTAKATEDELTAQLTAKIAELEVTKSELEKLKGQLEEYKAEESRVEHIAEITSEARKVLGESYEVPEALMEDLLGLYEGEAYKRVLTHMGELIAGNPQPEETPESKSGLRKQSNHTQSRGRIGIHNRRF
jgi:hypothetical protein